MSNLILNSLTFYGLDRIPATMRVNGKEFHPVQRPNTAIVEITDLKLPMNENHVFTSIGVTIFIHQYSIFLCFVLWAIQYLPIAA